MAAYVIANVHVKDPTPYADYRALVPGTLEKYGGRFLARGGAVERLEGECPIGRVVVIEFDSTEQARRWYHSEEYRAAKAIRTSASVGDLILVEGV
jgi:uncharacterized protein (DUF1330 family)